MLSVILAVTIAIQTAPNQQRNDRRTWYQAYADAQKNIQQKNWQAAITDIEAASRAGAPKPGRNILFYGDVYRDFNPDYYLGVAYLNLNQYDEANRAFERVKQAQLIAPRDSLFAEFTRQAATAKDVLDKQAASQQNAAVQTTPPLVTAVPPPTTVPNAAQQTPVTSIGQPANNPIQTSPVLPSATNQPSRNSYQPNSQQSTIQQKGIQRPPPAKNSKASVGVTPVNPVAPPQVDERSALVDFFSGQYVSAASKLSTLAADPNASPRAHFYLACSRAALALTGQADITSAMADARAQLALARDTAQFAADKALISPRIKQALGIQP